MMYYKLSILFFNLLFFLSVQAQEPSLLTVVLMVKNEEAVINQTLQPFVEGGVDSFLIFDTGSTDSTVEVVQKFFDDYGIERAYIEQESFIDFATSRNRALELAQQRFPSAIFMIMPDAEWYIHNVPELLQFCEQHKCAPQKSYLIRLMNRYFDYYIPRLIRCNQGVKFTGAVHEVLNHVTRDKVPGDIFFEWRTGEQGQEKSRKRWERDKDLLYNEYIKNPNDPRILFYLAQTYECLGDGENAYNFYKKRTEVNGWDEENFVARYRLARVMEQLQSTWPEVMHQYLEAFKYRPHRAEPLIKIAHHYYKEGNMPLCFLFAQRAAALPYPKNDILFVEKYLYDFTRFDLLGIAAWYVGEYEIGEWSVRQALKAEPDLVHLHKNFGFYSNRKK